MNSDTSPEIHWETPRTRRFRRDPSYLASSSNAAENPTGPLGSHCRDAHPLQRRPARTLVSPPAAAAARSMGIPHFSRRAGWRAHPRPLPLARRGVSNNAETPFDKHVLSKVEGYILSTVEGLRVSGLDLFETNRLPLMLSLSKHQPRFGENRQPRRGKRMSHANEPRQQTERITAGSTPCQHVERRGKC